MIKIETTENICEHWQAWSDLEWIEKNSLVNHIKDIPDNNVKSELLSILKSFEVKQHEK